MTTRLSLYNDALLLAGERPLASLSESREPRRLLDQVWTSDGVKKCLEMGQWHFAMRTVQVDYDPAIEPDFGYSRAFDKPTDWVLTAALCSDEYFREPLLSYSDEAGYWYSDEDTIYLRYVSDDEDYGLDLNKWPKTFEDYVAADFASNIFLKLSSDLDRTTYLINLAKTRLSMAKNKSAMADPTKIPARGMWSRARQRGIRNDRGNIGGDLY